MPTQTFNIYTNDAYEGSLVYASEPTTIVSARNSTTDLKFGQTVKVDSVADGSYRVSRGVTGTNVFGIVLRDTNRESSTRPGTGVLNLKQTETISVLRQGTFYAKVLGVASVRGGAVRVGTTTGTFIGGGTTSGYVTASNMSWLEAKAVGQIAKVRIDIVH